MKFVYLIRSSNGSHKIGVSKNPKNRTKQLQTANDHELTLISMSECKYPNKVEKTLHNLYCNDHKLGEWFNLSINEELNFNKLCQKLDNNFKIIEKYSTLSKKNLATYL